MAVKYKQQVHAAVHHPAALCPCPLVSASCCDTGILSDNNMGFIRIGYIFIRLKHNFFRIRIVRGTGGMPPEPRAERWESIMLRRINLPHLYWVLSFWGYLIHLFINILTVLTKPDTFSILSVAFRHVWPIRYHVRWGTI